MPYVTFREGFDFLGYHFTTRHVGVGQKSLKSLYVKVREVTRRQQGDVPVETEGNNTGLFKKLDKWVRNRVRAYIRGRWRDRGRWKILTMEELA